MSRVSRSRISRVVVTPVAFADPPLLNVVGVHQPWALRAIVELHTDSGLLGLGETYADETHLAPARAPSPPRCPATTRTTSTACAGSSPTCSAARPAGPARRFGGMLDVDSAVDTVYSPFEVACLDLQGHEAGVPVSDLLGGRPCATGCRSAATSSTSGPATPASPTTRGARR